MTDVITYSCKIFVPPLTKLLLSFVSKQYATSDIRAHHWLDYFNMIQKWENWATNEPQSTIPRL